MKEIQISRRLRAVADLVSPGVRIADVGCDHGYIPIYLLQKKRIQGAIAMDVNRGPLMRAQEHILAWGLDNYIETRLSDGLETLQAGEADCVVIAGMGGPLMERILAQGRQVLESIRELVLQPQSEIGHFREFLIKNGYAIAEENIIEEDGKYYPMMKAVRGFQEYGGEAEYLYGRKLLERKDPVLKEFLEREQENEEKILERLKGSSTDSARVRIEEIREKSRIRKEALAYYEM